MRADAGSGDPPTLDPAIRLLRENDVDEVVAMMRVYYADDRYPFDEGTARGAVRGFLAEPARGRLWVFDAGDEAAGYFALTLGYSLEYGGRDAFLDELYVRPRYRGRGLGTRALATVKSAARELGVRALHLEVGRARPEVMAMYRKAGFVDNDRCLMTLRLACVPKRPLP